MVGLLVIHNFIFESITDHDTAHTHTHTHTIVGPPSKTRG